MGFQNEKDLIGKQTYEINLFRASTWLLITQMTFYIDSHFIISKIVPLSSMGGFQ